VTCPKSPLLRTISNAAIYDKKSFKAFYYFIRHRPISDSSTVTSSDLEAKLKTPFSSSLPSMVITAKKVAAI